jgi:Fe-S cluster assembly protein SufD
MMAASLTDRERETYTSGFAQALARGQRLPAWLVAMRRSAFDTFVEQGWPTQKQEDWRFTDVRPMASAPFFPLPRVRAEDGLGDFEQRLVELGAGEGQRLLLVDGQAYGDPTVSPSSGSKLVVPFSSALAMHEDDLRRLLGRQLLGQNAFVSLSTAFMEDGALVHIPAGAKVGSPIYVLCLHSAEGHGSFPRTVIWAEAGSEATVVELHLAATGAETWSSAATEIVLEAGARLSHHSVQSVSAGCHVGHVSVTEKAGSSFSGHSLYLDGRLVRNDVEVLLSEEGATCNLDGVYLASGEGHVDNHTTIDHRMPRTVSRESYRGAAAGRSHAVFGGRIVVRPGAQQIDARQYNRNLLLSDAAKVNSKPHLEIFANDVKCSHGAATGRLDQEALFYLRSRGLGLKQASDLLVRAFLFEGLEGVATLPLREALQSVLATRIDALGGDTPRQEAA